jgi:hypothetical protein
MRVFPRSLPPSEVDRRRGALGQVFFRRSLPEQGLRVGWAASEIPELALFRVDPKTVTRWAKAGKLTSILWVPETLSVWLTSCFLLKQGGRVRDRAA